MKVNKDNKADVPADPSLSAHDGISDMPNESKAPIEAITVSWQYNSTGASEPNVFEVDPWFNSDLQDSEQDIDSWGKMEDDWEKVNNDVPERMYSKTARVPMNVNKDNKADVPADPSLSAHDGISDMPNESKAPIEAITVSWQYNSTGASEPNVFEVDPWFNSDPQDSEQDIDSWEKMEDDWEKVNNDVPERIDQNHVSVDPSAAIQDGRSDKPDESMAPMEVTRVPMQDTPPEASYTTLFDWYENDTFFDSLEEMNEVDGSGEEDNDGGDDSENDETTVKIKMTDGNNISSTLRINNESNVGHDTKRNNTIGAAHSDFESVTETVQTNKNGDPNSNQSKDDVELKNEGLKVFEISTELRNHTGSHLLVLHNISHNTKRKLISST